MKESALICLLLCGICIGSVEGFYDPMSVKNSNFDSSPAVCSREQSRRVRHFVESVLITKFQNTFKYDLAELPDSCLLKPERDLYKDQESYKLQTSSSQWDCLYCRKKFKSEFYLDRHLRLYHSDTLANGTSTTGHVCLGDMCPVFGCQMFRKTSKSGNTDLGGFVSSYQLHQKEQANAKKFEEIHVCNADDVAQLKAKCHEIMNTCFQGHSDMLQYAETTVCQVLACENGLLKGSLRDASDELELHSSLWIFQAICLIIGGLFFVVYLCSNGGIPGFRLSKAGSRSGHEDARRSKFQAMHYAPTTSRGVGRSISGSNNGNAGSSSGFFASVVNPVKKEIQQVFKTSKD